MKIPTLSITRMTYSEHPIDRMGVLRVGRKTGSLDEKSRSAGERSPPPRAPYIHSHLGAHQSGSNPNNPEQAFVDAA